MPSSEMLCSAMMTSVPGGVVEFLVEQADEGAGRTVRGRVRRRRFLRPQWRGRRSW